jgi:hypothetical protein
VIEQEFFDGIELCPELDRASAATLKDSGTLNLFDLLQNQVSSELGSATDQDKD